MIMPVEFQYFLMYFEKTYVGMPKVVSNPGETIRLCIESGVCVRFRKSSNIDLEKKFHPFLAHLSRRLTGELIGYPWIRRPSVRRPSVVRRPHFQTSSPLKSLGQSKPNFMWSLLWKGEQKFI